MSTEAQFWLLLTFLCIVFQGFFAMMEMAIVSFNPMRLHYFLSKKMRRAQWLSKLLEKPSRLFGTTLLGVNVALQVGSECSRLFYTACDLPPDASPLTQILFVLIFAELAPLFAARTYAEPIALVGVPIVFLVSKLATPLVAALDMTSEYLSRLFGGQEESSETLISREEIQKAVLYEAKDSDDDVGKIAGNIFSLRGKTIEAIMQPLASFPMLPSSCTVAHIRTLMASTKASFVPIYHRYRHNVIGIGSPRDLLRLDDAKALKDHLAAPWFLTVHASISQTLSDFRTNSKTVAIVLDRNGQAVGVLTLDDILDEIFGHASKRAPISSDDEIHIEKTIQGDMLVVDFNRLYDAALDPRFQTIGDLLKAQFGHPPEPGETVTIDSFEFCIEDSTILGPSKIAIKKGI